MLDKLKITKTSKFLLVLFITNAVLVLLGFELLLILLGLGTLLLAFLSNDVAISKENIIYKLVSVLLLNTIIFSSINIVSAIIFREDLMGFPEGYLFLPIIGISLIINLFEVVLFSAIFRKQNVDIEPSLKNSHLATVAFIFLIIHLVLLQSL